MQSTLTFKETLQARACDAYYNELVDGRYARTLKEIPGAQMPLCTEINYSTRNWLWALMFGLR